MGNGKKKKGEWEGNKTVKRVILLCWSWSLGDVCCLLSVYLGDVNVADCDILIYHFLLTFSCVCGYWLLGFYL